MLVLLIEGIYKYAVRVASCGMIYVLSFTRTGRGVQAILKLCLQFFEAVMLVLLTRFLAYFPYFEKIK
jgi:hypothetical protein